MNIPNLSVIVVEYHCIGEVQGCLASLREYLKGTDWECIVTSNSEYDAVGRQALSARLVGLKLLVNEINSGYAGGVNRALQESRAPFVLVLNPDCRLTDYNIPRLIAQLEANPDIGMIGPRVEYAPGIEQPSCRRFPRPWTFLLVRSVFRFLPGAVSERRRYLMEDCDHGTARDVDWISGGAMLVSRKAIEQVGLMDERYFLYMEDVDWCRRFWREGLRVRYEPQCVIRHPARHGSLRGGWSVFTSPLIWHHLKSLVAYFRKFGLEDFRASPRGNVATHSPR